MTAARSPGRREEGLSPAKRALLARLRAERSAAPGRVAGGSDGPTVLRGGPGPVSLVLLHPVGGALFCYARLVAALGPGIRVLGFAADGARPDVPAPQLLPALATRYVRGLGPAGRTGPCVLAGWSMGGLVAYEMARQLAALGARHPVLLLDSVAVEEDVRWDEPEMRRAFTHDLGRLAGADPTRLPGPAPAGGAPSATVAELLAAAGVRTGLDGAELERRYQIFRIGSRAMTAYRPGPYDGPVTVLSAAASANLAARWQRLVGGPLRRVVVPGDHYGLFEPGTVERVAGVVDEVVRDAGRAAVRPGRVYRGGRP